MTQLSLSAHARNPYPMVHFSPVPRAFIDLGLGAGAGGIALVMTTPEIGITVTIVLAAITLVVYLARLGSRIEEVNRSADQRYDALQSNATRIEVKADRLEAKIDRLVDKFL